MALATLILQVSIVLYNPKSIIKYDLICGFNNMELLYIKNRVPNLGKQADGQADRTIN